MFPAPLFYQLAYSTTWSATCRRVNVPLFTPTSSFSTPSSGRLSVLLVVLHVGAKVPPALVVLARRDAAPEVAHDARELPRDEVVEPAGHTVI